MADTLLLINDDAEVLRAIGDYFERAGYRVWREPAGQPAINTFLKVRPDVVVLDLRLPDADGLVVLERLKRENGAVILLSGHGDIDTAIKAMQLGAENFLTKPVDMTHLAAAVARVVEKVRLSQENASLRALVSARAGGGAELQRQRAPTDRRYQALSLSEVERQHIERTLRHHAGNRTRAAIELGISRATLINKIKAYSLNV
jgi:two-component system, NtrC family, nitrogen regulation response regulator NtrX